MLLNFFTNFFKSIINYIALYRASHPYWVKIITKNPRFIYYFGPCNNYAEAHTMHYGFVEDLVAEQANVVSIKIKRYLPKKLTITKE